MTDIAPAPEIPQPPPIPIPVEVQQPPPTNSFPEEAQIPFEKERQLGLLGYILANPQIYERLRGIIKPEWFMDTYARKLVKALITHCEYYTVFPKTDQDLFTSLQFMKEAPEERMKLQSTYQVAKAAAVRFSLESLSKDMEDWMKYVYLKDLMGRAAKHFAAKNLGKAAEEISNRIKGFFDLRFDSSGEELLYTPEEIFTMGNEAKVNACTLGDVVLDKAIDEHCEEGCLLPKQTTVIMAPANIGKTTVMINIALANVRKGKRVLFVALEGSSLDLREKIWSSYLGESKGALYAKMKDVNKNVDVDTRNLWSAYGKHIEKNFAFLPFVEADMTVQRLIPILKAKQQESLAKFGKGFDLVVCDYPAILQSEWYKEGGDASVRARVDSVYRVFTQMGAELNCHMLLAVQTNREAARNNRFQGKMKNTVNRLIIPEDCAESYDPVRNADNLLTLNRDETAQQMKYMTVYVGKNRSGEVNKAILMQTDFACARTHGGEGQYKLKSCWYYGSVALEAAYALRSLEDSSTFENAKIPNNYMQATKKD